MWCGVVGWVCGVVWRGVVRCSVVQCGVVRCVCVCVWTREGCNFAAWAGLLRKHNKTHRHPFVEHGRVQSFNASALDCVQQLVQLSHSDSPHGVRHVPLHHGLWIVARLARRTDWNHDTGEGEFEGAALTVLP